MREEGINLVVKEHNISAKHKCGYVKIYFPKEMVGKKITCWIEDR
jgi:hypothetical protein